MALSIEDWMNLAAAVESLVTVISLAVGGVWVYTRYIRQQERYPNIEFTADVLLIGIQNGFWVAELITTIENKGKAQHKMEEFGFDLNAINIEESVKTSDQWGGQVNFSTPVASGSFLPERFKFFFIDPGVKAKYSYITRIPVTASFVVFHSWFKYSDGRNYSHTAERTIAIPRGIDASQMSNQEHPVGGARGG